MSKSGLFNPPPYEDKRLNFSMNPSPGTSVSMTINNLDGPVHVGETYNTSGSGSGTVIGQNNVSHAKPVDDCSAKSESDEETVKEEILKSTISLSLDNMMLVARKIGEKYSMLGRNLKGANFSTQEINNIIFESRDVGREEGIYRLLERWSQKAPSFANVGNLAYALVKVKKGYLANELSLEEPQELMDI